MTTIDNVPTRKPSMLWAIASAVLLLGIALACWPVIDQPWGVRPWFAAVYLGISVFLNGLIALFLALQIVAGAPTRALAWLGAGYIFAALLAVAQFMSFPGLLEHRSDGEAVAQASAWLWILWHAGFPCFVLLSVFAKAKGERQARSGSVTSSLFNLFPLAVGIAAAVAGSALLLGAADQLPAFIDDYDFTRLSISPLSAALIVLSVGTLVAVIQMTRLREVICVWLAVAMFAFTLEILLSIAAMARYNAGWYVARTLSLMSGGALMVALLIEHWYLHRDAEIRAAFHEQEALHDALTGLFNRRYLSEQLDVELGRAKRHHYPVSVLMLDVDHFKHINDQQGHAAGDQCLRALARVLIAHGHRFGDFSARYGGEEFVVVLPKTDLAGAIEVAEDIRRRVEALSGQGVLPFPMTVSIGIACTVASAPASTETLLAEADRYLYRAKQGGRNRVEWCPPAAGLGGAQVATA